MVTKHQGVRKEKYIINKTTKTHMKIQSWHDNPTVKNRDSREEEEKTYSQDHVAPPIFHALLQRQDNDQRE